jgi:hypothetical protein
MKKTVKIYNILLTLLFLGVILICFLNDVFRFYKVPDISTTENRKPASKPIIDFSLLDPFPKNYENYFNDQFPFRQDLSLMNTLICFFYFHQSPLPKEVELGQHGWLFYYKKESEIYNGKLKLDDWQVVSVVKDLHDRTLMYRKKGIRFYVAFAPMKAEVYPENAPFNYRRATGGTLTDKITETIRRDSVIQYIDLKEGMLKSKVYGRLYAVNDNHWNKIGAFYGYSEIIRRIRLDFPSVKLLTKSDIQFTARKTPPGNLAIMIGLQKYLYETDYVPNFKNKKGQFSIGTHKKPDWAVPIDNYEYVMNTGDSTLPNAVFIRDSFTDALMPFLGESFNKSTYIFDGWRYLTNGAIIDDLKPEIVVLLIFEPHISHLAGVW